MGNYHFKATPKTVINISLLKQAIANQVNDDSLYKTTETTSTEDTTRFERVLKMVREKTSFEHWKTLVYTGSKLNSGDFKHTLRETFKDISADGFNPGRLYTLLAFVVDVAAFKLKNKQRIDIDELLDVLHALLIHLK